MAHSAFDSLLMEVEGLSYHLQEEHLKEICEFLGFSGTDCCKTATKSHLALLKKRVKYFNGTDQIQDEGQSVLLKLKGQISGLSDAACNPGF